MFLMILCALLIGLADTDSTQTTTVVYGVTRPRMSAFVAVLITLVCPFTFAATALST